MDRKKIIENMVYYYSEVIGKVPSQAQINAWAALSDYSLMKIYHAWQDLYTASVFSL